MNIRRYQPGEESDLWDLFFHTVRNINIQDYTPKQVRVWAPDEWNIEAWCERIAGMNPFVCMIDEQIAGYAALLDTGYVDHFYVHHARQGQGVGKALFQALEAEATRLGILEMTSDVSITARPFFESRGFRVLTKQEVVRNDVTFHNFKMMKSLALQAQGESIH